MSGMTGKTTRPETPRPAAARTPSTGASAGPLRTALRGMSYEEGREALSPAGATGTAPGIVQAKAPEAETETVAGTLWGVDAQGKEKMPTPDDVNQGQVGDCFLLAVLAGMANTKPQAIKDMIVANANGTYTVTFQGIGFFKAARQTVSADFVKGKHARVGGTQAFWPLVVEKAYAGQKGGVDVIDKGGNPGTAGKELTDLSPDRMNPQTTDGDTILGAVEAGKDKKVVMTASTMSGEKASDDKKKMADEIDGLHFSHAYTVMDVDRKGRRIKLRNPWGYSHPRGTGWLGIDEFKKFYDEININD